MRLLDTKTLRLKTFVGDDVPRYAILSHTWGSQEVSYEDICRSGDVTKLEGWDKIRNSCAIAASLHYKYIWNDTCCIDKASSADLSEAINSMFRYYEQSKLCIAFIADVDSSEVNTHPDRPGFRSSRWFSRGWTLQELIAPPQVAFYDKNWVRFGTRYSLRDTIENVTNIPADILLTKHAQGEVGRQLDDLSVAQRMNWAAKRQTTRPEDMAYCLLGLFDINMPLLYGEGLKKAFRRLQQEIIKSTEDESIYSWYLSKEEAQSQDYWGLLAESPRAFGNYGGDGPPMRPKHLTKTSISTTTVSNRGIHGEFDLSPFSKDKTATLLFAFLDCDFQARYRRPSYQMLANPVIILQKMSAEFVRVRPDILVVSRMRRVTRPAELVPLMGLTSGTDNSTGLMDGSGTIFVPHDYRPTRYPSGIMFYYKICNSSVAIEDAPQAGTWPNWSEAEQYMRKDLEFPDSSDVLRWSRSEHCFQCQLDFGETTIPSAGDLQKPKVLSVLPLLAMLPGTRPGWKTRLVIGLDPLGVSCLGTPPALHFAPWVAFQLQPTTDGLGLGEREATAKIRQDTIQLDFLVRASLRQERINSRLFYRVSLDYVDGTEKG